MLCDSNLWKCYSSSITLILCTVKGPTPPVWETAFFHALGVELLDIYVFNFTRLLPDYCPRWLEKFAHLPILGIVQLFHVWQYDCCKIASCLTYISWLLVSLNIFYMFYSELLSGIQNIRIKFCLLPRSGPFCSNPAPLISSCTILLFLFLDVSPSLCLFHLLLLPKMVPPIVLHHKAFL